MSGKVGALRTRVCSILQIESGPDGKDLPTPELREAFARFWGIHIIAINPEPNSKSSRGYGASGHAGYPHKAEELQ